MKQIVTVIRPHLAEEVLTSLRRAPIEALSVTEVKGYGRQKSYLDEYQETEYSQAFVPKVEITLWVDDVSYSLFKDLSLRKTAVFFTLPNLRAVAENLKTTACVRVQADGLNFFTERMKQLLR